MAKRGRKPISQLAKDLRSFAKECRIKHDAESLMRTSEFASLTISEQAYVIKGFPIGIVDDLLDS